MANDRWMEKEDVVHIYNGILLIHKKEWNFAIYGNMDELGGHYASEISQTEKDKYYMIYHLYVESKKTHAPQCSLQHYLQ